MEFFSELTDSQSTFIKKQPVFFVATAAPDARINLSPKGMDSFRVLSPTQVGYLDVGGSGNETHAHLAADGRITIMFCAFDRPALILRLYGRGRAVLPQDPEWDALVAEFTVLPGTRQIFLIDLDSIQESCGWGVPFLSFDAERPTLAKYHAQDDPVARLEKTAGRTQSIDGLPVRVQTVMPMPDGRKVNA
jgi:Pyridoxamine 5'-phosphate oxidase